MARELVNRVQRLRRDAGLEVTDRIRLSIRGAEAIETAAREHEEYIAGETLALEVVVADEEAGGLEFAEDVEIDNNRATVSVERMTEK
jgi:isoleucyl-tRNA synthetase